MLILALVEFDDGYRENEKFRNNFLVVKKLDAYVSNLRFLRSARTKTLARFLVIFCTLRAHMVFFVEWRELFSAHFVRNFRQIRKFRCIFST